MTKRAALVVDGFNLYHAVDDLGENFLKWVNLWRLGEVIIPSQTETLVSTLFCTAFYPGDFGKRIRHDKFNAALRISGVEVILGHYVYDGRDCPSCDHTWQRPTEKQTDINVALGIFDGARRDAFDHGYLLSADSDQTATVAWFNKAYPDKELTIVVPPARKGSKNMRDKGGRPTIQLNKHHLERALFRETVSDGKLTINRPKEYDPPEGYVHWEDRPTK